MLKSAQKKLDCTVLVEGISASIIKCKALENFTVGGVSVNAGQGFFLVRSGSQQDRYYVVTWYDALNAWRCSCGAGSKSHAHTNEVKAWIEAHIVKPRQVERDRQTLTRQLAQPKAPATVPAVPNIKTPQNSAKGNLYANRGFSIERR